MSKIPFSDQELAFFDEGDTLSATDAPADDFSDLDGDDDRETGRWAQRAMAVLALVTSPRSA